jgi:hypothetical protein
MSNVIDFTQFRSNQRQRTEQTAAAVNGERSESVTLEQATLRDRSCLCLLPPAGCGTCQRATPLGVGRMWLTRHDARVARHDARV